jgi:adenylate cyclase
MMSHPHEPQHEGSILNSARRLYGLRPTILTALVGLLLVAVLPIITYTYWQDRRAILDLSDTLIDQVSATTISTMTGRLWHAAKVAEMSSHFVQSHMDSLAENAELESYLIASLKVHPRVCNSFLADEQGSFLAIQRLPDGTIATEIIDRTVNPPSRTLKYRDSNGKVIKTETSIEVEFDPRARPWYQGAISSGKLHLTDMYVFFREKRPGITFSAPIMNSRGNAAGVIGLDVELDMVSSFLRTLKVGKTGIAFITDSNYKVLACTDFSQVVQWEGREPRLMRLDELGVDWLTTAYKGHVSSGAGKFTFEHKGKQFMGSITPFPEVFGNPWRMGVVVPEDDFLGSVKKTNRFALVLASVIFAIAIGLAIALGRSISRPIMYLSGAAEKIRNFELDHAIDIKPRIKEIHLLATALTSMQTGLRAFKRYVPAELVRQLIRTGEAARRGGKKSKLTFFFSDIAGFTPISEGMQPEALMIHISEYLDELTGIIMESSGTVDKYIGDAIMAFWGAPASDLAHAEHACDAALACQARIRELNKKWKGEGKAPLPTRIGIHTGEAIVGNIGSSERMNYTVIGDNVNLASRLEGANKLYGTGIIISQSVYEQVTDMFISRPLDLVAVKGKEQTIMIYELIGRKDDAPTEAVELCKSFAQAFELYLEQNWEGAIKILSNIQSTSPSDRPTSLYLQRCRNLQQNPPTSHWNGITYMNSK